LHLRNFNHDGNTKSFTSHNQWTTFLLLYLFVKGTPTTVESPVKGIGASWHADLQQRAPFAHVVSCQGEDSRTWRKVSSLFQAMRRVYMYHMQVQEFDPDVIVGHTGIFLPGNVNPGLMTIWWVPPWWINHGVLIRGWHYTESYTSTFWLPVQ
jgi:hypothetical protein